MIKVFSNEDDVANEIAKEMQWHIQNDENPVFCLASGSTPKKSYKKFSEQMEHEQTRIKRLKVVSLDEWVGIDRTSEGSCYQMLYQDLFSLIPLDDEQIEFFDGTATDLEKECRKIDNFILSNSITFSLMGVGMNGHIGLNEPGSAVLGHSSVVDLSKNTKEVAQKYFLRPTVLEKGITIGLNQVIRSKRVVVAVTGERKADIVRKVFSNSEHRLPAQELLGHDHIDFFLDKAAAQYLDATHM
ncbi:6-phosphogluconolactonase [Alicyclobacillus fastidiosus]|uniref:6-phosphogluconolactonase n=1 Tax=Alicyclobacillus fastidiosus TaxID=392011 RepID=A0ABV5AB72_9BACL|nr:6-phosphogluconolactonase [Alicyclobacillus fastidiosus]WEH10556.1 6-phosphogluconolactonase [Alicyclobacillus fastidiosus]